MTGLDAQGSWLPLMDYSVKKGVSLSTLRRYIKAGKVQFKVEQGRYLLFDDATAAPKPTPRAAGAGDPTATQLQTAISKLENDLTRAREEIAELKTLIAFYEEGV